MVKMISYVLIIVIFPAFGLAENIEVSEESVTVVDFKIHKGFILFNIEIDGESKKVLLDSGAPSLILNEESEEANTVFSTVDGDILASQGEIDHVRIGNIKKTKVPFWSMDLSHMEHLLGINIDGLLGVDLLESYDLLIDYESLKLSFLSTGKYETLRTNFRKVVSLPFVSHFDNLPVVEVNSNGEKLLMSFDTGAGISVVSKSKVKKHVSELREIKLGKLRVLSLPIATSDMSQFVDINGNQLDGILSVNALNADRVLFSFKRKLIYLFWEKHIQ
ncbi:MAG: putative aspartyl protease [Limisphaerales bacterium]|jgi:predicted aspartyl protease